MCPHTPIYVSSYYYVCVLILCVVWERGDCYICVLILLYMCPHTTYVSSYYYISNVCVVRERED
jgi:hypothetical protein